MQLITAPLAILVDAASFLVSALMLSLIRSKETPPPGDQRSPSMRHEIVEGLRAVLQSPILLALAAAMASFSFFGGFIGALYSLYAVRTLELTPAMLGLVISGGGVGALLGAAFAERVTKRFGLGKALIGGLFVSGVFALLIPFVHGPPPVAASVLFGCQIFGDAALMLFFINAISLRQSVTPDRLLGRVNASTDFLVAAVGPLGLLLGGVLG